MTLCEYRNLPFGLQIGLLLRDGTPLLTRHTGREKRVLYGFRTYYVEAGLDASGELQFVRSFSNPAGLDPYLTHFDWRILL